MRDRGPVAYCTMVGALAVTLAVATTASLAQTDSTWRDHERALQAARQANDTTVYRAQLNAIYSAVGATQRIATRYAALALGAHDIAGASRWMGALAAMGDALDTGLVSQYGALAGPRAVDSLRAMSALAMRDAGAPMLVARLPDAEQ